MRWAGRVGCPGAHPSKGTTSTANPDGQTEARRQGAVRPKSRPATAAVRDPPPPSTAHVVLAGDVALLEAQEGDVADEGVPHGGLRGRSGPGAPGWALNGLERGSGPCQPGWGRRGGGRRTGFLLLSSSGSPRASTAGTRTPLARMGVGQACPRPDFPWPAGPRRWGLPHHRSWWRPLPPPPIASAAPQTQRAAPATPAHLPQTCNSLPRVL